MKRTGLILAAVILLAGASVQTQSLASGQKFEIKYDVVVEDDKSGDYLVFSSRYGNYTFVRCSDGTTMTGRGVVKRDGCQVNLYDIAETHKVLATVDECGMQGKAAVEVYEDTKTVPAMKETLSDTDIRDNVAECEKYIKK